jgi:hypothetical protein
MNNLIIEPTHNTPAIQFREEGSLLMEGRSMPEDVMKFYTPLLKWAADLNAQEVELDINLVYLNSSSIIMLLELLKVIDANNHIKTFYVDWHYDQDDEDILESAQIFEEILRKAQFRYHELSHAA